MDAARFTENLPKNRYRDISPCVYFPMSVACTICENYR